MKCLQCGKEEAVTCEARWSNILVVDGPYCSRQCFSEAFQKGIECMDRDFSRHVMAECTCIVRRR